MGIIILFLLGIYAFVKYCEQSAVDGYERGQLRKRRSVFYHDSKMRMRNTATGKIWTRQDDDIREKLFAECKQLARYEMKKQIIIHNESIQKMIDDGNDYETAFKTTEHQLFNSGCNVEQVHSALYGGFYEEFKKAGQKHGTMVIGKQIDYFLTDMANYIMYPYWERIYKEGQYISPLEENGYGEINA